MEAGHKPAIFVFATAYHPFIGGAEIAIQEVARRLAGEFSLYIITARMRRDLPRREARPEGIVIRVGFGTPFDKWLLPFAAPFIFFRERSGTRAILWGMDISAGSLAAAFTNLLSPKTPFIFTIQYGYGGGRLRRGRFGAIGKSFSWMLGRADAVTAISKYLAMEAANFGYSRPVELLPNGVPLEAFLRTRARTERNGPSIIITTSRLVPKNGVDVLIRAVAEIRKSRPDIRCHILGDGPERPSLEALARSLGIASSVIFFGGVANDEVPRHLAEADVFVRPSRSEGMGNAFVEALASGLPIVGTPVEGVLDIIDDGKTGLFAKVDDPTDVAEKTMHLLRDRALSRRIVEAGGAMVRERFSWDAIASGYAGVFRAALLPRILIATPMLPPDIGGPGAYAKHLAKELVTKGHKVYILRYGAKRRANTFPGMEVHTVSSGIPSWVKHFFYLFRAWRLLAHCDAAIALDPFIVGMPAATACWLRRKPVLFRLEGDFLWEMYAERTERDVTLREFYETISFSRLSLKECIIYLLLKFLFRGFLRPSRIIFSSPWRRDIFQNGYILKANQSAVITPLWPQPHGGSRVRYRTFVFAGRFVRVKNIPRLIRAFAAAAPADMRLELIGDGPERVHLEAIIKNQGLGDRVVIRPPLPHAELRERIARAHAFVLPSLSDVSPNVILECIASGTPFLLTKETGFYETLKEVGVFVDPLDEHDIEVKLRILLDPRSRAVYQERLAKFDGGRSWGAVANDWLELIRASV